jgi:hypothetical protein
VQTFYSIFSVNLCSVHLLGGQPCHCHILQRDRDRSGLVPRLVEIDTLHACLNVSLQIEMGMVSAGFRFTVNHGLGTKFTAFLNFLLLTDCLILTHQEYMYSIDIVRKATLT